MKISDVRYGSFIGMLFFAMQIGNVTNAAPSCSPFIRASSNPAGDHR